MESDRSLELNALTNELIQGIEVARKLKADLTLPSSTVTRDLLVQRILSSYDKALLILRWNASTCKSESQTMHQATKTASPEPPISVNKRPSREDVDGALMDHQDLKHDSKKRKMMPKLTDQVRVYSENGFEGPLDLDDGYSWRKYGQKPILGAKYPRSYYRCTFRNTKGCLATKQVQRSDEDPVVFDITYRGTHTCCQVNSVVLPPKSPDKQDKPQSQNENTNIQQESLAKFQKILTVNTDNLGMGSEEMAFPFTSPSTQENHSLVPSVLENDNFLSTHPQTHFLSPNTPESNYFPSPSFQINEFDWVYNMPCSEYDSTEIISADKSTTNSPIFDFNFNFSLDPVDIGSNFPFDD